MNKKPELILKEDGFPVTALFQGMKASIIHPQNSGAWICCQFHCHPHESAVVRDQLSEYLPPKKFQLALDPVSAHALGQYLIEKAKQAIEP